VTAMGRGRSSHGACQIDHAIRSSNPMAELVVNQREPLNGCWNSKRERAMGDLEAVRWRAPLWNWGAQIGQGAS
jgi:hypothetical protein